MFKFKYSNSSLLTLLFSLIIIELLVTIDKFEAKSVASKQRKLRKLDFDNVVDEYDALRADEDREYLEENFDLVEDADVVDNDSIKGNSTKQPSDTKKPKSNNRKSNFAAKKRFFGALVSGVASAAKTVISYAPAVIDTVKMGADAATAISNLISPSRPASSPSMPAYMPMSNYPQPCPFYSSPWTAYGSPPAMQAQAMQAQAMQAQPQAINIHDQLGLDKIYQKFIDMDREERLGLCEILSLSKHDCFKVIY